MKKIISALLSVLAVGCMSTAASALEKNVDYIVIEETIPEYYVAYGDAYPASPASGLPECTTGQLLKGEVIATIDKNGSHCWEDKLGNNASAAFDGNADTLFDPYVTSRESWMGVIFDQAYELTEVRFKVREVHGDRSYGAALQASQDGEKWITLFLFKTETTTDDYFVVTPDTITDQAYIDAGVVDYSSCWFRNGSYKMYRYVNLVGKHGEVVELELYGNPAEPSEIPEGKIPLYSGECGENLTWNLYDDGELAIDGEGEMGTWESWDAPWSTSLNDILSVTIGDGVTSISAHAFENCTNLTSVTMGNNVTSIGDSAFIGCSKLNNINFPDSITSIGASAFTYCENLTTVTLGNGVTSIGDSAFAECTSLTSVTIPESVTFIDAWAFESCPALTKATILSRNVEFGFDVFFGSSGRFTIHGYSDSTAQAYAEDEYNNHRFVALDLPPETEAPFEGPEGTVNLAEAGTIITSSANDVSAAFDGSTATGVSIGGAGSGAWMGIKLEQPSILTLVALSSIDTDGDGYTEAPHRIFKTMVEGSNDGETWERIMYFGDDYLEYEDFAAEHEAGNNYWTEYAFLGDDDEYADDDAEEPVAYTYYRVWNDDDNDFWGEVAFWGTLVGETPAFTPGDINGDNEVDITDVIDLFRYSMMPDMYPITYEGETDFNKDSTTDIADVLILFRHSMMPDMYPLA